jgi:NADPH-dependent 2,4-dienoyl-CoA reductase/sulfur reductase-like enzyme
MSLRRVVVVGNGIAGLTAADSLRGAGYDGELTLVGDEPHPAYSRPALSKALLRNHDDVTSHQLPPAAHGAVERLGIRVTGLDPDRRLVRLDGGEGLPYDGLVVATGCRARRLGPADSGELTLRSIDDALLLRERLAGRPSVVVVGGGPLGMEIASGCLTAGCEVTLVSAGAPLRAQLGEHLSELFTTAARRQGLRIVATDGASVRRSQGHPVVELGEGGHLAADVVVTAVGDIPNVEWLASSGLLRHGAVEVDERGRLRPDVVAAGDVAAVPWPGGRRRLPLWHSAIEQAKVAAAALLHGEGAPVLDHRPYFWTEQFGLALKAVGHLPFGGVPTWLEGGPGDDSALLRWDCPEGAAAVAAINYRIAIPRLRRLSEAAA